MVIRYSECRMYMMYTLNCPLSEYAVIQLHLSKYGPLIVWYETALCAVILPAQLHDDGQILAVVRE